MSTQFTNRQWRLPNNENKSKQSNYSMDFDGSGYITCNQISQLNSTTAFSISVWCKLDNVSGILGDYVSRVGVKLDWNDHLGGFLQFTTKTTGSNNYLKYNVARDSNWHHIVCTYDAGVRYIYLDGVSVANDSAAPTQMISTLGDNFLIGKHQQPTSMAGQIDAVAIFDYALTDGTGGTVNQIAALYGSSSTGIGNPMAISGGGKPVAYYQLGDKSAFNGANYLVPNIAAQEDDGDIATSYSPYALDFDAASGDEINTNYIPPTGASARTISIWFYQDTSANADICGYGTNTVAGLFDIILYGGNVYVHGYGAGQDYGKGAYTVGVWNHYVITYDGTTAKGYVNNVATPENTVTLSTGTTNTFKIGNGYFNIGNFNGKLSNCSIWNAALTSAQVSELYNEGVPSNLNNHSAYSNLVSWWQLGSNSSFNTNWTVLDEKGSNNGTSVNMTEADIVDGVGSSANGLSSGMGGDEVIGDAPYSTANSLSVNMDVEDRVTDTPS